jgi:hypothetical protein
MKKNSEIGKTIILNTKYKNKAKPAILLKVSGTIISL